VAVTFGGQVQAGYGANAPKPTGLADGDLWVIWVAGFYDATTTPATASGFTVISGFAGASGGDRLSGTWLAKIVTNAAGEPADVAITPGGSVGDMKPQCFYVRGASNVSVADAVAGFSSANTDSATELTLPSVAVGRNGSRVAVGEVAWDFDQWHDTGIPSGFVSHHTYTGDEVHTILGSSNVDAGANPAPVIEFTFGGGGQPKTGDGLAAMVVFQPAAESRNPLFFGGPSLTV
jgi:hypothetical protein